MSGPYRNHVEARSSRAPARQFVSETHDHKPNASLDTGPDFFTGISVVIEQMRADYATDLPQKMRAFTTAFEAKDAPSMKLAGEDLARFLGGMQAVANSVVRASLVHINRRPRP